jgi:RNA polymerase sigma-70 factor (ECF subfamily)
LTRAVDRDAAFAQFSNHRAMLRAYLRAILSDADLVEDTLSDVSVEIARCWAAYDPTLPFGPWARGVARRLALKKLHRLQRRESPVPYDVIEALGTAMDEQGDRLTAEGRKQQLVKCLERLTRRSRELVSLRYFQDLPVESISIHQQRSPGAIYTALSRIHAALLECMRKAERRP